MKSKLFVGLGVLIVIGVGISFAFYMIRSSVEGTGAKTTAKADLLKVTYDAGDNKLAGTINPKDTISKNFRVNVTPTNGINKVTYAIKLKIEANTFVKCSDANYNSLSNDCEKEASELIYTLKDSNGVVLKTGDLTEVTGEVNILLETKTVTTSTDYNYTLEITFKDTGKDQNHNMNKNISGKVEVEFAEEGITTKDIIAGLNAKTETPDFSVTATTNEGVYAVSDGMYGGTSYYWRGATTTNYVRFAGKCWRIIRINGDGTMRLIYDGATCHANGEVTTDSIISNTLYNSNYNRSEYVGWTYTEGLQRPSSTSEGTDAPIKTALENWYNTNIGNNIHYANKVANGKYCNDRNVQSGYNWSALGDRFNYAVNERIYINYAPTLSCEALDTYQLNVGLIAADEVVYAGGQKENNVSYYLYNGQHYWTMSPFQWWTSLSSTLYAWVSFVRSDGSIWWGGVNDQFGIRPVINLKADVVFKTGGTGTLNNPYVVVGAE